MNPFEKIRDFLKDRSDIRIEESVDSITALSNDSGGFDVSFREWKMGYIVSFGEWHEYLPKSEKAASVAFGLFKFGLSDSCRLKVHHKGNVNYKCGLEYIEGESGQWKIIATQSALIHPFWEEEKIHYLQNRFITGDRLYTLFEEEDFKTVITEITYERKYGKYALTYLSIWLALFLKLNDFDFGKIQVSFILFLPAIFVTLLLPLLVMRNWFNDRKFGRPKKVIFNPRQKKFMFLWVACWSLGLLLIYAIWGIGNLATIFILLFPFMLAAFCIPVFILMQKK